MERTAHIWDDKEKAQRKRSMLKNICAIIPFLEKSLNATILDYSVAPLTKQGDNFGSTLLAINIKVKLGIDEGNLNEVRFHQNNFFK